MSPKLVYLLTIFISACLAIAQDSATPPSAKSAGADEKTIHMLVQQLGDNSFEIREAAHKRLADIGDAALESLQKAAKDNRDPEVQLRLEQLLKTINDSFFIEVRRFEHSGGWTQRLAVTPDDRLVVALGFESLRCLNLADGKEAVTFEWPPEIRYSWGFGMSRDGQRVITGGDEKVARIFEVKTGKLLKELKGHTAQIYAAAILADGKRALTGGFDKSIRIWDIDTGREILAFESVPENVQCMSVSPNGKLVAVGHSIGPEDPATIRLWDMESGREVRSMTGHTKLVGSIRFSPDGNTVLSSSFDKTVRLWNVADGKLLKTFEGHTDRVECAAFSPDGKRVLSAGDQNNPVVKMWDIASGTLLFQSVPTGGGFLHIAALADGRHCVTCGKDGAVRVWQWKR